MVGVPVRSNKAAFIAYVRRSGAYHDQDRMINGACDPNMKPQVKAEYEGFSDEDVAVKDEMSTMCLQKVTQARVPLEAHT